jgi:hypothetical protein
MRQQAPKVPIQTHVTFDPRGNDCPMLNVYPAEMVEAGFTPGTPVVVLEAGQYEAAIEAIRACDRGCCRPAYGYPACKPGEPNCAWCCARAALSALGADAGEAERAGGGSEVQSG